MNLFLGITLYNDQIHGKCSESILKNSLSLMSKGHTVMPLYNSDLYIERSRNFCVNLFLKSNCDDIIFIDSDLSFQDDALLKLIEFDKDIIAGAYRYKKSIEEYTVTLDFSRNNNCKEESTGLVYVERAPTGLMRINRRVFERMISHYNMKPDERDIYSFFETGMIFENDNNWYGEDVAFCKKWTDMKGEIFVAPDITFIHIGTQEFKGNLHEFLMGRRVEIMDAVESGIKGWMADYELEYLKEIAKKSDSIVEIGSWKGRSTKVFLENCKGTVYAVDHWNGTESDNSILAKFGLNVYDEFISNVGFYDNLKVLRGYSTAIAENFNDKVDTVFIDAGHTYEECKADIESWLPKCRKLICGHDYVENYSGVVKAVNEIFGNVNTVGSIWWVEL
jgi:hypothetical protein